MSSDVRKLSFAQALKNLQPDVAPAKLFELDAKHMVGVIRLAEANGFWERHDGGDEILVVLQGQMDFTFRYPDSSETVSIGPGDILHIPRGVAHGATIHEEVHILFFSPKEGNTCWTEGKEISEKAVARH